jgi:hypothetical protein
MSYISVELRQRIRELSGNRCEYCLIEDEDGYMPHEFDHIYAEKHGGETTLDNLCLSCWICNRHKGTDLTSLDPLTGEITRLFHSRQDNWTEHFQLNDAWIEPLTAEGRVTVKLLQLNTYERVDERRVLMLLGRYPRL